MRERPQSDREKSAGRAAQGPAPPERKKKTGYYQKMSRNTEDAPATQPEAFSSSSRSGYSQTERAGKTPGHEQSHATGRETPPEERRAIFTDDPEEPGRLCFTSSDELKQGAGESPQEEHPAENRQGKKQARRCLRFCHRSGRERYRRPTAGPQDRQGQAAI